MTLNAIINTVYTGSVESAISIINGFTDGDNCNGGITFGQELSPDVSMDIDVPANTDVTLGYTVNIGAPIVTSGEMILMQGDVATTQATLLGELVAGNVFEVTANVTAITGAGFDIFMGSELLGSIASLGTVVSEFTLGGTPSSDLIDISTFAAGRSATITSLTIKRKFTGVSGLTVINANSPITFSSHAGVTLLNQTTGDTATVISSTSSAAQQIEYTPTWAVLAPIVGDVVHYLYNSSLGNYEDVNNLVITTTLTDGFSGSAGDLNGTTPDTVGSGTWTAGLQYDLDGAGLVEYAASTNRQSAVYDAGGAIKNITLNQRYTVGANVNITAGVYVRGADNSNNVSAIISGTGVLRIVQRVAGSDTNLASIVIGLDPTTQNLTINVVDDGVDIVATIVENDVSVSVNIAAQITIPADNNVGLWCNNVPIANEIQFNSIDVITGAPEQMEDQDIILTNCLDVTGLTDAQTGEFITDAQTGEIITEAV